ncbi:PaaI family thioesterase [Cupriavidus basilensis]|uniref:PaaI family thioesterase n=1 Tax=Cupriavidus basilensis TaxID=68895 RepID=A0ABT6AX23_9BURK|nr:PaaI family thioesterase [Cupriavidus basilensis]MDF3837180.1 PaaI family thioesterase [Cupriavidus basilensis]
MPDNAPANQPYALENPFLESLDVAIVEWQPDLVRMSLMPQAAHVNNTGVVQGGILATLLDAAAGYAGLFPENGVRRAATTISLNVNYVSSAQVEPLQVVGRRVGGGRRVFFSNAEITDSHGRLIATAQAAFRRKDPV